jgi:type VI secretion system protein ImpA
MPLREDLLQPIPGDNPCGANLYYTPLFDKIKEARRQESAGPMGAWEREVKTADYPLVIKLCEEAWQPRPRICGWGFGLPMR